MALITYLTRIQFDFGALNLLADELKLLGIKRPLIATDKGVVNAGIIEQVKAKLGVPAAGVYDGTPANPTEEAVLACLEVYKQSGADGVIAVGGGSSMDLGKCVALLATHPLPLRQYAMIEGGVPRITNKVAPVVAIPTTSGTGSEVGRGAVIVFPDDRKLAVISPFMIPRLALCDPDLTLGLPPGVTAGTGMDALAHGIETFLSPVVNPPAEAIGFDGATRAVKFVERAFKDGKDRDARWQMMMASMEGAMAFQKGLGAVHSLSHPLGGLHDLKLHHGTLNAVVMPAVLRFNAGHVGDKYDRLRQAFGLKPNADLPDFISGLNQRLGLPPNLKAMGVASKHVPGLVPQVLADHCTATNARKMTAPDVEHMLADAMG